MVLEWDDRIKNRRTIRTLQHLHQTRAHELIRTYTHKTCTLSDCLNLLHGLPAGPPTQPSLAGSILRLRPQEIKGLKVMDFLEVYGFFGSFTDFVRDM